VSFNLGHPVEEEPYGLTKMLGRNGINQSHWSGMLPLD